MLTDAHPGDAHFPTAAVVAGRMQELAGRHEVARDPVSVPGISAIRRSGSAKSVDGIRIILRHSCTIFQHGAIKYLRSASSVTTASLLATLAIFDDLVGVETGHS